MATACIGNSKDNAVYAPKNYTELGYSPVITALTDNNAIISLLFGQKQSIEWDQFKLVASYHLKAKDEDVDHLKSVLAVELGMLDKSQFSKFLRWFSPLVPESDNLASRSPTSVWKISTIANLVRQPWFHGFDCTSRRLKNCNEGTFLVRFGCQAPHFVLALKDKSTESVMEWRVLATSGSVRLQDGERFQDLHKLVDNYSATVPCGASCPLAHACI